MGSHKKMGCRTSQRLAMLRNLTTSALEYKQIVTTVTRAKEVRGCVDKMISLGKEGTLHARRRALAWINSEDVVTHLFESIAPACIQRAGGYTRVIRLGRRRGDSAEMALLELVDFPLDAEDRRGLSTGN